MALQIVTFEKEMVVMVQPSASCVGFFQEAFSGSCPWSELMDSLYLQSGPGTQTEHQGSEHTLPSPMGISLICS